jgi:hypothetical protein
MLVLRIMMSRFLMKILFLMSVTLEYVHFYVKVPYQKRKKKIFDVTIGLSKDHDKKGGRIRDPGSGKQIFPGSRIQGVKKHRIPDPYMQHS